ncbi:MAG: hypothetical protein WBW61_10600 [Rhodanobacteraceae bacterium]
MSHRDSTLTLHPDVALATALRALPDAAPEPDLWPDMARTLARRTQRKSRRWQIALPVALAAGIALALLIPRTPTSRPQQSPATTASASSAVSPATATTTVVPNTATATTDVHELADLRRRSQSLERWIAGFAHAPQDSRDLMAAVEVEDLIALVDVQLGATRDRADALPLWRQRVALLEDLATIRVGAATLAANDTGATASVAPFNRMN